MASLSNLTEAVHEIYLRRTHRQGFSLKPASHRSDPHLERRLSRLDFACASVYSPFAAERRFTE
jgi:hypothetical protein